MNSDCTELCKSIQHGEIITSAITKRSISDTDLCAFLTYSCCRCECILDSCGRSALHLAASCGRTALIRWLICSRQADVNSKDKESGYTPLHRSIFYGKIHAAVELMKLGASMSLVDLNGLTALEHAMMDGLTPKKDFGELYSWGSNPNNLFGTHHSKNHPSILDSFHRTYPNELVKHICIDQFHIVIITKSGKVYSCGHGHGGRLGLKNENSITTPILVDLENKNKESVSCTNASISKDHSLFLTSDGTILSCGLNTYRVLGHSPPPEKLLSPKPIHLLSKEIEGVIACQYHSVAWGHQVLYVWGLNIGQLGNKASISNEYFLINPKALNVLSEMCLITVASSNGAIVFCTQKGHLYLLHEFKCKKIASRLTNVLEIAVIGGKLDSPLLQNEIYTEAQSEVTLAVLTNVGNIYIWQESDQQLCRCIYNVNRAIDVKQIHLNLKELLLVSIWGEVYKGIIKPRKKKNLETVMKSNEKSAFHKFLEKDECIMVALHKISKIQRAIFIQSDQKGKDYCAIQETPYTHDFPTSDEEEEQMKNDLQKLLEHADIYDDIHDFVMKLENIQFAVHKYILFSRSTYFEKLLMDVQGNSFTLKDISPELFRQFLLFLYTDSCDLLICGEVKNRHLRALCHVENEEGTTRKKVHPTDPLRMLQQLAKKFECVPLQAHLSALYMDGYIIKIKQSVIRNYSPIKFDRLKFSNLFDVTINCDGKEKLLGHKCILSSRLEYFNNMFSTRWKENQLPEVTLPFPKAVVAILLEYLYTDSVSQVENVDIDHLLKTIILADQFFVTRLKMKCESLLSKLLTLKNTVQILSFANIYNANTLKDCCEEFITLNMPTFLEMGYLNDLDEHILEEISSFYLEYKQNMHCRVITPYSVAVSDETIASISSQLSICGLDDVVKKPTPKKKSRVRRIHNSSISENEDAAFVENMRFSNNSEFNKEVTFDHMHQYILEENLSSSHDTFNVASSPDISFDYHSDFPDLSSSFGSNDHHLGSTSRQKPRRIRPPPREKFSSFTNESCSVSPGTPDAKVTGWKMNSEQLSPLQPFSINNIISEEKQQKQNLIKLSNKLLIFTQIEDQAIDELAKFYNTQDVTDEVIVIERIKITSSNSSPWISTAK